MAAASPKDPLSLPKEWEAAEPAASPRHHVQADRVIAKGGGAGAPSPQSLLARLQSKGTSGATCVPNRTASHTGVLCKASFLNLCIFEDNAPSQPSLGDPHHLQPQHQTQDHKPSCPGCRPMLVTSSNRCTTPGPVGLRSERLGPPGEPHAVLQP